MDLTVTRYRVGLGFVKYGSREVVYSYCFYRNINQSVIFDQIARVPRFHIIRYSRS